MGRLVRRHTEDALPKVEQQYFSAGEIGRALGMNAKTVKRMAMAGQLRYFKPGKEYRFLMDEVVEDMERFHVVPGQLRLVRSKV